MLKPNDKEREYWKVKVINGKIKYEKEKKKIGSRMK